MDGLVEIWREGGRREGGTREGGTREGGRKGAIYNRLTTPTLALIKFVYTIFSISETHKALMKHMKLIKCQVWAPSKNRSGHHQKIGLGTIKTLAWAPSKHRPEYHQNTGLDTKGLCITHVLPIEPRPAPMLTLAGALFPCSSRCPVPMLTQVPSSHAHPGAQSPCSPRCPVSMLNQVPSSHAHPGAQFPCSPRCPVPMLTQVPSSHAHPGAQFPCSPGD